jgi:hypothetical protein
MKLWEMSRGELELAMQLRSIAVLVLFVVGLLLGLWL